MRGEWRASSRVLLTYDAPERVGAAMGGSAHVLASMSHDIESGREACPADVLRLLDWCARHTLSVEVAGERIEAEDMVDALDEHIAPAMLIAYAHHLTTAEGLGSDLLAHARDLLDLLAAGGCECPTCRGRQTEPSRSCALMALPQSARTLVLSWWPLREHIDYSTPLWAYQLHQQWQDAAARAALARHEERTKKERLKTYTRDRVRDRLGIKI